AVDVHRAGAAHALAAGAAEGQGRIDLVLDLDDRVQDHRPALVEIDLVGIDRRVAALVGIPAVDLEGLDALRPRRRLEALAGLGTTLSGQGEFGHVRLLSKPAPWAGRIARRWRAAADAPGDSRSGSSPDRPSRSPCASS